MNSLDALGNPVILGNKYGYSTDSSGITEITIGVAKNFTDKGYVTLIGISKDKQYGTDSIRHFKTYLDKISVKPIKLFPIWKEQ